MKSTMFRLAIFLAAMIFSLQVSAAKLPPLRWLAADSLAVVNRADNNQHNNVWQRVDVDKYADLTPKVREYFSYPTGLAVAFSTNSPYIYARWGTTGRGHGVNTTLITQSGLALYIKKDGRWIYAGVGRPKYDSRTHLSPVVEDMDNTMKECLLYLPIYDGLDSLSIGVAPDATVSPLPKPFGSDKRMVVMGSSITHGTAVSNPAMTYAARLGRELDMETANLGASGQCKLEEFFGRIAADSQADVFVFDVFSNPSGKQIDERLERFVEIVRAAYPDVPLIFLQTLRRESTNFNNSFRAFEAGKREAAERGMRKILAKYDNVYFINPGMPIGEDHEATVDGVHPSDLGFERILQVITPQIKEIIVKD